jgi:hypothetical protein
MIFIRLYLVNRFYINKKPRNIIFWAWFSFTGKEITPSSPNWQHAKPEASS